MITWYHDLCYANVGPDILFRKKYHVTDRKKIIILLTGMCSNLSIVSYINPIKWGIEYEIFLIDSLLKKEEYIQILFSC